MIPERYGFLDGEIVTSQGEHFSEEKYAAHFEHVPLPYSQASAYRHCGTPYMVGALARMNLARERLHQKTRETARDSIAKFPSTNIFHNNLAQAIELLHSTDDAIELLQATTFVAEPVAKISPRAATGVGVVEAPRGTLYHRVTTDERGMIMSGAVIVPTGQNQLNIEADIARLVEQLVAAGTARERIEFELEKLIRAYDPCMSCAAHFLKVQWE
jgi:coenzyme F420-reducing hydrogenase alpha subunit